MLVCIDKITCARMYQRVEPRWKAKLEQVQATAAGHEADCAQRRRMKRSEILYRSGEVAQQAAWMEETHHRDHHQRGPERGGGFRRNGI